MMNTILQDLRQQIECPISLQHMSCPITLCCNGHSRAYRPGLHNSPICRGNLTNIRNFAMEGFAEIIAEIEMAEEPVSASSTEPGRPPMDILAENKLKQLQCCKCMEYMIPPIMQCMNCGAFICTYCNTANAHSCGNGNQQTNLIRNGAAEALSRSITHRCKLYNSGCTGHFHADHKKQHEEVCLFRRVSCPFTIVHPCAWNGPLYNVKEHVNSSHIYHVLGGTSFTANVCQYGEYAFQAVYGMDNFFFHFAYCNQTYNSYNGCYDYESYVTCLFIGNEDEAKGFEYILLHRTQKMESVH